MAQNNNSNNQDMSKIGSKGGKTTVNKYGPKHMSEIGQKGAEARNEQRTDNE